MTAGLAHREVDGASDQGVRNSQPEGIGRVVALDDLVCWNNLGRNVVFADQRLRARAVFGRTLFPGDDEPSQYDLDVHSILDVPDLGLVVVLNHLGVVRGFRRADLVDPANGGLVAPASLWWFVADVERTVAVGGRLVGSAPRQEGGRGLVVSASLDGLAAGARLPVHRCAEEFGEVTALGIVPSPDGPLVALGGVGHVALAPLVGDRLGEPGWEAEVGFRVATVAWDTGRLWAAGPESGGEVDDYDWERLKGGGFAALDPVDGRTVRRGLLPADVAWGTGGVAVAPFGGYLAAVGRTGRLHLVDPLGVEDVRSTPSLSDVSLGIAHMTVLAEQVCCGFNRGGYRLHAFAPRGSHSEPDAAGP